jgi:hypothetical protein
MVSNRLVKVRRSGDAAADDNTLQEALEAGQEEKEKDKTLLSS